ncbi:MAG: hypothetical protein CMM32_07555 [Rhodospirillaceae bacterium]|mgnify:CR=1 FL=1|nr:hypothetical protein [Rhodospirillaceae bacterium]
MYTKHLIFAAVTTALTWNIASSKADNQTNPVETRAIYDNQFNPSVGIVLNGKLTEFSAATSEFAGFGVGEEGERSREGIQVDESEINFSASVDDKFYGSMTAAIVREDGSDIVELEEAYGMTLPGSGLPTGLAVKMGRAFWTLGYLNEHHAHSDDFADRPLPYRVFLNKSFNDDGVEASYILPTDIYAEVGGGSFRGDDFPLGGGDGEILRQWSAFARIGGDIGLNQSWRVGSYMLSGNPTGGRTSNEDAVTFIGDSDLLVADFRYTLAPTGNPNSQEVTLQGEYFRRDESGTYQDTGSSTGVVAFSDSSKGWYAQAVYKFNQQWRIGTRYSRLTAPSVPAGLAGSTLDASGHDPKAYAAMIDWTNSEFSRIRFQYNHEKLTAGLSDNQIILQYVMSIGAHGSHKY